MNSQDNEVTNAGQQCNKKTGANLLNGSCTGRCWKANEREAGRSLVWYWSLAVGWS